MAVGRDLYRAFKKRKMKTFLFVTFAILLESSSAAMFQVEANSTSNSSTDGITLDHPVSTLLDGDLDTWWKSHEGDSVVALSFSEVRKCRKPLRCQGGGVGVAGVVDTSFSLIPGSRSISRTGAYIHSTLARPALEAGDSGAVERTVVRASPCL